MTEWKKSDIDVGCLEELTNQFIQIGNEPKHRGLLEQKVHQLTEIFGNNPKFPPECIARLALIEVGAATIERRRLNSPKQPPQEKP